MVSMKAKVGLLAIAACLVSSPFALAQSAARDRAPAARTAEPARKPANAQPAARRAPATANAGQSDYWTIDNALPTRYGGSATGTSGASRNERDRKAQTPTETPPLGRVPLQDSPSTIGFTSGQSASSGRFSDGRPVPGLNPETQSSSSYVGMSLSVPSNSKSLLPPLPLPFGRPE